MSHKHPDNSLINSTEVFLETEWSELDHTENAKEKQKFHKKHLVCMDRIYAGAGIQAKFKQRVGKHCCFACSRLDCRCQLQFRWVSFFVKMAMVIDNFCYIMALVFWWTNEEESLVDCISTLQKYLRIWNGKEEKNCTMSIFQWLTWTKWMWGNQKKT